jgi:hypothetical protein
MDGEWGITDIRRRIADLQTLTETLLSNGDKGDVIVDGDQLLLDDIDLGTFN